MLALRRILFPTDFSRCARQAMDHALFLAEDFGAELHLLHVVVYAHAEPAGPEAGFAPPAELSERFAAIAASELGKLRHEAAQRPVELRQIERRGFSAGVAVLEVAEEIGADLIVMGTHGRRGAARFFVGSVAQEVVRYADCPVLTLREQEEARALAPPQRLLVPIDFSAHSGGALAVAADVARRYGASLQLLHVLELPPLPAFYGPPPDASSTERLRAQAVAELRALAQGVVGAGGPSWEEAVVPGLAAEEIVRFAAETESGLVVLPTRGRGGVDRLLLGSVAERVLRMASCPVLTLRPGRAAE